MAYNDNAEAPAIFVNNVGAIHKIGRNTLQVVFVTRLRNADGEWETNSVVKLIWDEQAWLDVGKLFRFAMEEWQIGMPPAGGSGEGERAGMH